MLCRHMNAFSAHTFRLVKSSDEWYYAKFVLVSDQGIKNNTLQESITVAGENPDFGITDLYDSSVSSCHDLPLFGTRADCIPCSRKRRLPELEGLLSGPYACTG
jgi:hypothetical protein